MTKLALLAAISGAFALVFVAGNGTTAPLDAGGHPHSQRLAQRVRSSQHTAATGRVGSAGLGGGVERLACTGMLGLLARRSVADPLTGALLAG